MANDRGGLSGGIGLGEIFVVVGVIVAIVGSLWVGVIFALIGLTALAGSHKDAAKAQVERDRRRGAQ
jgi:hypothetical protein